ncbi:hypothetical protein MKW98_019339 [Papaver atlanticum]|uniref:Uncharacterized protein n=1 Tax=Papaver atlanticum TaxID=357466 RepID=A0AAD4S831_9MAGN|nr:hypothetical protein MKW98_019339 [Papaver atlanticum]
MYVFSRFDLAVCSFYSYTTKFDKLDPAVKETFDAAYDNIHAFHFAQKAPAVKVENMKGVRCKRVSRCITSVGLYVPGGTAVLPSTALMLAVVNFFFFFFNLYGVDILFVLHQPARIAGCKIVNLATPPGKDVSICKDVVYCAKKASVTHILKVEKIFGPANQYVTAAKMVLQVKRIWPDSQVVLVIAGDGVDVEAIEKEISSQCQSLPRGEFASKALSHSFTVFSHDMVEHLIVNVKDAENWEVHRKCR